MQAVQITPKPTSELTRCLQCGNPVDPKGVTVGRYCFCTCRWPKGGCGERIYFDLSTRQNLQPFNVFDGKPHHLTCRTYLESRHDPERMCPRCQGVKAKGKACLHCGWKPGSDPTQWAPVEWGGRVRGFFNHRKRVYHRLVRDEHYARVPRGFGIQDEIVERLNSIGCEWVVLEWHKGDGSVEELVCGLDWFVSAPPTTLNPADGSQRFVRLDQFRTVQLRGKPQKGQTALGDWA